MWISFMWKATRGYSEVPTEGIGMALGIDAVDASLVKSPERTVRILEMLAGSPTRLTLAELQHRTGYPRSSLHALVPRLATMLRRERIR